MGHLINPVAFRLGVNKSWESTWYIKNIYYAEFLHNALNLRNFAYRIFTTKDVIESGIFLSEIFFFKIFKTYIINIYLYHLELEKVSYKFINRLYVNYYKKNYKNNKLSLPPHYWFLHNADLYAFIFVFYHVFFNVTNKFGNENKKIKLGLNIDENIEFIIEKFNKKMLKKVKGRSSLLNDLDLYLENLVNKIRRLTNLMEWKTFILNMRELKYIFKKKFRYNHYKHNLLLAKLKETFEYTDVLKKIKKKYNIKKSIFFYLIHSYLIGDWDIYKVLKNKLKLYKKKQKNPIKYLYKKEIKNKGFFSRKGTFWYKKWFTPTVDYDLLLVSSDNIIDNFFLNIFLYIGKKVGFAKFKNFRRFHKKWGYIIKFLKFLNSFEYKNWFGISPFFLFLSASLYNNLKARKNRNYFNVRDLIYRYIYIWLGKYFFFPFFKNFTEILFPIFIDLIKIPKIKVNYFFISVNDVSARFIAVYISLKLRKNHNLKSIINPVKKELWRLSRSSRKDLFDFKLVEKIMKIKSKKKFIRLLKLMFFCYNKILYNKIKKNNIIFTIEFFWFKYHLIKNKKKSKKLSIISKWIKIEVFFDFFYGKLQNDFNVNFWRAKLKRRMRWKKKRSIFTFIFSRLNYLSYNNIKKFKIININYLLIFTNIIKYYVDFNFFILLWDIASKFNRRNSRHNLNEYKKSGLIAFKMAFKGRFSRKQRASSIWYSNGRASLNRLDLEVDYAFVKVPLKNSIVSIKIWLFRNTKFNNIKFILNF